jgi:hypothetical protein|tara:strand:+ start:3141 stop:3383 length:243 start_codon:yes stop_codon:yes gene_type:complete
MELWAYVLGTCLTLTNECMPETVVLDFTSQYVCEVHALLTTHIHHQRMEYPTEVYASYAGCFTHKEMELAIQEGIPTQAQ